MLINKRRAVKIAKGTFKLVATLGTAIIVKGLLDSVTPRNVGPAKRVAVLVGGYVLSDMIVEKVQEEAGHTWDRTVKSIREVRTTVRG